MNRIEGDWEATARVYAESNRQLREELDAATFSHQHDHDGISAYSVALFGRDDIGFTDGVRRITTLTTALAAAKEALEYAQHRARCQYALTTDELATVKTGYDAALARIAECEKGAA